MEEDEDGIHFGAFTDNKLVGIISLFENTGDFQFRKLAIDPEYQGKGIGNQLMRAAMRFCEEKNFLRVQLSTFAGLDSARHLYEKHGFKLVEEYEGDTWGVRVKEQVFEWVR